MIPLFNVYMCPEAIENVKSVLYSGYVGQKTKVTEFEKDLGRFLDTKNVVTTNSCTSALHLALHLLKKPQENIEKTHGVCEFASQWNGLKTNSEVLVCPLTCFATVAPIMGNGLKIKWVDVDPETFNIDLDDLERKISPTTKVIMLMHWGGSPVDLYRVRKIQQKCQEKFGFRPAVIEDCAHAFGAKYHGSNIGSMDNICCFSFQAIKHLTTADGGCITLPHELLYSRAKLQRWYGMDREGSEELRCYNDFDEWGFKFHMNDVNATIGIANLKHMNDILTKHTNNAIYYQKKLLDFEGIELQYHRSNAQSAHWLFTLKVDRVVDFNRKMKEHGIHTNHVHERNDKYTCVKEFQTMLPNLDKMHDKITCIPVGWWVTDNDREYIVDRIKEGW